MFYTDGHNVGSWKLIFERQIDHVCFAWSKGYPNFLKIPVAKFTDFECDPVVITVQIIFSILVPGSCFHLSVSLFQTGTKMELTDENGNSEELYSKVRIQN